jgi:hypothetical protein
MVSFYIQSVILSEVILFYSGFKHGCKMNTILQH